MRTIAIIVLFHFMHGTLQADERQIPPGIVYNPTTPERNAIARDKIQKALLVGVSDDDLKAVLSKELLICGPRLWGSVSSKQKMRAISNGTTYFNIPLDEKIVTLEGKTILNTSDMLSFWRVMIKSLDTTTPFRFRPLSEEELKDYWAIIPFDIDEPVFVAENDSHGLIVQFSPHDLKLMWIDELLTIKELQEKLKNGKLHETPQALVSWKIETPSPINSNRDLLEGQKKLPVIFEDFTSGRKISIVSVHNRIKLFQPQTKEAEKKKFEADSSLEIVLRIPQSDDYTKFVLNIHQGDAQQSDVISVKIDIEDSQPLEGNSDLSKVLTPCSLDLKHPIWWSALRLRNVSKDQH